MKAKRIIISTCMAIVVLFAMFPLGMSASVPTGPSGVNFANIPDQTPVHVTLQQKYQDFTNGEWLGVGEELSFNAVYDQYLGGFGLTGDYGVGLSIGWDNALSMKITFPETGALNGFGKYTNDTQAYSIGCRMEQIAGDAEYDLTAYLQHKAILTVREGTPPDGEITTRTIELTGGMQNFLNLQPTEGEYISLVSIEFLFMNLSETTWYVYGNLWLRDLTILQEVEQDPSYVSTVTHQYVPFNEEWFQDSDSTLWQEGYDQGLEDGLNNVGLGEVSWTGWIFNAVTGFMAFEIMPNLPLWGLLSILVAIPLLVTFLKMFAGG